MQAHQHREEEEEPGPENAFEKSPFQLTAEDVYDISYVVGREILKISSEPHQGEAPTRVAQLQFKVVRILEMLEALVNESNLTVEELKMERDNLKKEVEGLRKEASPSICLGPDKMIIDLTDPNRPRFTLQELRDVLQERNQLKAQLLIAQEELQCYKSREVSVLALFKISLLLLCRLMMHARLFTTLHLRDVCISVMLYV
uniref:RILP-like protein 2 n=1 Tax=Chelydra serpentina TaxID=8475 RepID=A0A8C3XVF5_CHESE